MKRGWIGLQGGIPGYYFGVDLFEAFLDFGEVDILAPGLFAFS